MPGVVAFTDYTHIEKILSFSMDIFVSDSLQQTGRQISIHNAYYVPIQYSSFAIFFFFVVNVGSPAQNLSIFIMQVVTTLTSTAFISQSSIIELC